MWGEVGLANTRLVLGLWERATLPIVVLKTNLIFQHIDIFLHKLDQT